MRDDQLGQDRLSKGEITKDAIQAGAEAAANTVGEVATILTRAVGDVAGAVGGFATEIFEIRDASRRAKAEHVGLTTPRTAAELLGEDRQSASGVGDLEEIEPGDPA